jgi:hypothetical protein
MINASARREGIVAVDPGTHPGLARQIGEQSNRRLPHATELFDVGRPRDPVGLGADGPQCSGRTREVAPRSRAQTTALESKGALRIGNVVEYLPDAPLVGAWRKSDFSSEIAEKNVIDSLKWLMIA